ncbi:MAG: ABC transporter substrate-binding protein [Desulfobacteraceae bacterium]|nr:ABC transporter substrate-binding protein [Desulfobacteraceae bacterium]
MKCSSLYMLLVAALLTATIFGPANAANNQKILVSHAIAMNGESKYDPDFAHFDYVNPDAPKAGLLRQDATGTFDSFNPFIAKGNPAAGLGLTYDTLMARSYDEPFTQYGLIAEKIEFPEDRSWVIFHINKKARFHDGLPVKAPDVVFSFKTLVDKGSPLYARYYADVSSVKALDDYRVKFSFGGKPNREMPLILSQLAVLPEHYWKDKDFSRTTLAPPLGSGPYKVNSFDQGRSITYTLDDTYWGRDLPVNRGRYNFKHMRYDYYRDRTISLAAFKSGEYDFRQENTSKHWATAYKGPPFEKGLIKTENIKDGTPAGMQCFVMNQRRSIFSDRKVREALIQAFDFEWTNRNLFYSMYKRTDSYFENSEMQAMGLPSEAELKLLEPLREHLWPEVFTHAHTLPSTNEKHGLRKNLRKALKLLNEADWEFKNAKLRNKSTGKPFSFEILLHSPAFERVCLPFTANLKKLGIHARVRLVDTSQYINRLRNFDFDMIVGSFGQSLSPGNEQRYYWHSEAAGIPGSRNYSGIQNKAVDELVEKIITAETRQDLVNCCKALDRVLLWGHYVIPHWYSGEYHIAYTAKLKHPPNPPPYALALDTWWVKTGKSDSLLQNTKPRK